MFYLIYCTNTVWGLQPFPIQAYKIRVFKGILFCKKEKSLPALPAAILNRQIDYLLFKLNRLLYF